MHICGGRHYFVSLLFGTPSPAYTAVVPPATLRRERQKKPNFTVAWPSYRNIASKRPPRRYDFAGVNRRPGDFTVWPGRFLKEKKTFCPPGVLEKSKTHTRTPLTRAQQQHSSRYNKV